jgi:hypothetical protein
MQSRVRSMALAVCVVAAATASPAASATTKAPPEWTSPKRIASTAGLFSQVASTAPNGADLVLWASGGGAGSENVVRGKFRLPGEERGRDVPTRRLGPSVGLSDLEPTPGGDFWVVFTAGTNSDSSLARFDPQGRSWSKRSRRGEPSDRDLYRRHRARHLLRLADERSAATDRDEQPVVRPRCAQRARPGADSRTQRRHLRVRLLGRGQRVRVPLATRRSPHPQRDREAVQSHRTRQRPPTLVPPAPQQLIAAEAAADEPRPHRALTARLGYVPSPGARSSDSVSRRVAIGRVERIVIRRERVGVRDLCRGQREAPTIRLRAPAPGPRERGLRPCR